MMVISLNCRHVESPRDGVVVRYFIGKRLVMPFDDFNVESDAMVMSCVGAVGGRFELDKAYVVESITMHDGEWVGRFDRYGVREREFSLVVVTRYQPQAEMIS